MGSHFKNTVTLVLLGLLNFMYFLSMWIVVWAKGNYTRSFSWGLENFWELKVSYWVWFGVYAITCFIVFYLFYRFEKHLELSRVLNNLSESDKRVLNGILKENDEKKEKKDKEKLVEMVLLEFLRERKASRHKIVPYTESLQEGEEVYYCDHIQLAFTIIYVLATLTKLCALPCIAVYDMSTNPTNHYASATVAFAAAILCDFCLLVRRWTTWHIIGTKSGKAKLGGFMDRIDTVEKYRDYLFWISIVTTLWVMLETTFALLFLFQTQMGFYEFWLTSLLVSIYFWQVADFWVGKKTLLEYNT